MSNPFPQSIVPIVIILSHHHHHLHLVLVVRRVRGGRHQDPGPQHGLVHGGSVCDEQLQQVPGAGAAAAHQTVFSARWS